MSSPRPNILLITADQFRFDAIAAHGNPAIRTPNLDRLAAEGVTFTRAYSESPVCVPARAGILTGLHPHQSGVFHNGTPLRDGAPTVVRDLARAGYHTQAIGKMHFTPTRAGHGFERMWLSEEIPVSPEADEYLAFLVGSGYGHVLEPHGVRHELYYSPQPSQLPESVHATTWTGERTAAYLAERAGAAEPFFCWTSFIKPHPPFDPPLPYALEYDPLTMPDPVRGEDELAALGYHAYSQHRVKWTRPDLDLDRIRTIRAYYYACVSHVDAQIGRILDALEETGQRKNTLVVFTADHGEYLGDHWMFGKRGFHDAAARLPMVVSLPGTLPGAQERSALVGLTDLAPTFRALAGLEPDARAPGGDLLGLATGHCDRIREIGFGQYQEAGLGLYTAMDEEWKYIYSAADRRETLLAMGSDETVDHSRSAAGRSASARLREGLREFFAADGYSTPFDGADWRHFESPRVAALPGTGDRSGQARGRQYAKWRAHPAAEWVEPDDFYA